MKTNQFAVAFSGALAACAALLAASPALAECQFAKLGDLKVDTKRGPPMAEIEINGKTGLMVVDTGAFNTTLSAKGAAMLGVPIGERADSIRMISGDGKEVPVRVTTLRDVVLGGAFKFNQLQVAVMPGGSDSDVVGSIGVDILAASDIEFDLANGRISLFSAKGCGKDSLAYWTDKYSTANLRSSAGRGLRDINTTVELNGKPLLAQIRSGVSATVVDQAAAAAAGVRPGGPGVEPAAPAGMNAGRPSWTGSFESFAIGAEQVKNVRLPFTDLWGRVLVSDTGSNVRQKIDGLPSLVLGLDFLRSHRVLIANSQDKVYFSYNGGPIFAKPPAP